MLKLQLLSDCLNLELKLNYSLLSVSYLGRFSTVITLLIHLPDVSSSSLLANSMVEHCHTVNLMPNVPISCLPPSCVDPKVQGLKVIIDYPQPGSSRATYRPPPLGRWSKCGGSDTVMVLLGVLRCDYSRCFQIRLERPIIPQPQCGRCHRAGTGQATLEVIGSKWSYTLKWCKLNTDDDDDGNCMYDGVEYQVADPGEILDSRHVLLLQGAGLHRGTLHAARHSVSPQLSTL